MKFACEPSYPEHHFYVAIKQRRAMGPLIFAFLGGLAMSRQALCSRGDI